MCSLFTRKVGGIELLYAKIRSFWREDSGAAALESVFAVLFLSFMIAPTLYLMRVSESQLDGSWGQRTASRQHAHFSSCNGVALANPFLMTIDGVNSTSYVYCSETDIAETDSRRFWNRMEAVVTNDFPTLVDDMKDEGDFMMHKSNRMTTFSEDVELGTDSGALRESLITANPSGVLDGLLPPGMEGMAPSTEYYRWHAAHWRKGHDRVIWAGFSAKSKKLFPNVFPSR